MLKAIQAAVLVVALMGVSGCADGDQVFSGAAKVSMEREKNKELSTHARMLEQAKRGDNRVDVFVVVEDPGMLSVTIARYVSDMEKFGYRVAVKDMSRKEKLMVRNHPKGCAAHMSFIKNGG